MTRPSLDVWALELAQVTARRATCLRRAVGCVLLDSVGHVLATGYNGVSRGKLHCNEPGKTGVTTRWQSIPITQHSLDDTQVMHYPHACEGAGAPSGQGLDTCQAIHAESNALLQCSDVWSIYTCYTTVSPCMWCVRLLLNTSCERIVFCEEYPHPQAKQEWLFEPVRAWSGRVLEVPNGRRTWEQLSVGV